MEGAHATGANDRPSQYAGAYLLVFLTVYFALQVVLRVLYASGLGLDEAELLVITQKLAPGYGSQPPLYNWLQIGAFSLFGVGVPALAIVKNLLLWATFVFMYLAGRLVLEDDTKAALTTLTLFTIPQLAWESQRALAHTVIAVTMAALTLYVMLRLLKSGHWAWYVALGVCWALGTLSKYNYILFVVSLLIAAISIGAFRPENRPPAHPPRPGDGASSSSSRTSNGCAPISPPPSRGCGSSRSPATWGSSRPGPWGCFAAVRGILNYAALPIVVFAALAFIPFGRKAQPRTPAVSAADWTPARLFVLRVIPIALALLLLIVLGTRATEVRDRWLQPILFVVPLALYILFERRLTGPTARALAATSVVLAIGSMTLLTSVHLLPDLFGAPQRAVVPYRAIEADIRRLGFGRGYILAEDSYIAGNLKHLFPESTVAEPEYGLWPMIGDAPDTLLLAWSGNKRQPPDDLRALLVELCGSDAPTDLKGVPLSSTYEHSDRFSFKLTAVVMPMCRQPSLAPPVGLLLPGPSGLGFCGAQTHLNSWEKVEIRPRKCYISVRDSGA